MREEEFYYPLDEILYEINAQFITMNTMRKKHNINVVLSITEKLISKMRQRDHVFDKTYSRLTYVGSYFDGSNEFDLNLVLKLPFDLTEIQFESRNVPSGFAKLKVIDGLKEGVDHRILSKFSSWVDEAGYLLENKIRQWLEGVLHSVIRNRIFLWVDYICYKVTFKKNGLALTLHIDESIDVDLAFTIEFPPDHSPPASVRWIEDLAASWCVLPNKPTNCTQFWKLSFYESERKLISDKYNLKFILRLLKGLQDSKHLGLNSYVIKTLFLWEAHHKNSSFWDKRIGFLFVFMLRKLENVLFEKSLPNFWYEGENLLGRYTQKHLRNKYGEIKNIITNIEAYLSNEDYVRLRNYIFSLFLI